MNLYSCSLCVFLLELLELVGDGLLPGLNLWQIHRHTQEGVYPFIVEHVHFHRADHRPAVEPVDDARQRYG